MFKKLGCVTEGCSAQRFQRCPLKNTQLSDVWCAGHRGQAPAAWCESTLDPTGHGLMLNVSAQITPYDKMHALKLEDNTMLLKHKDLVKSEKKGQFIGVLQFIK